MTTIESTTFIIVGLTKEGRKFRPSDWAEHLCGVMSAFGAEPMAYRFMLNFAQDNDLQIIDGVCSLEDKKK